MTKLDPLSGAAISEKEIEPSSPRPGTSTAAASPLRTIESEALFGDRNEVVIAHQGSHYRLRITRQGKLILNK